MAGEEGGAAELQLPDNSRGLALPLSLSAADPHLLTFHTSCGSHAAVLPDGRTAHRPKYADREVGWGSLGR